MRTLNYQIESKRIESWLKEQLEKSGAQGFVLGMSGGVDSSVVAALCCRAIGSNKTYGLIMPEFYTPQQDTDDAVALADQLCMQAVIRPISQVVSVFRYVLPPEEKISMANLRARVRMIILYYYANYHHHLVAGTGDRSEALIGYFTKYGDGGVDLLPIGHLYKTEVRAMALHLGIPGKIAAKPSSPQLYPGHKATDEIPADYDKLDPILSGYFDGDITEQRASAGRDDAVLNDIGSRYLRSDHKRKMPPTPLPPGRVLSPSFVASEKGSSS